MSGVDTRYGFDLHRAYVKANDGIYLETVYDDKRDMLLQTRSSSLSVSKRSRSRSMTRPILGSEMIRVVRHRPLLLCKHPCLVFSFYVH